MTEPLPDQAAPPLRATELTVRDSLPMIATADMHHYFVVQFGHLNNGFHEFIQSLGTLPTEYAVAVNVIEGQLVNLEEDAGRVIEVYDTAMLIATRFQEQRNMVIVQRDQVLGVLEDERKNREALIESAIMDEVTAYFQDKDAIFQTEVMELVASITQHGELQALEFAQQRFAAIYQEARVVAAEHETGPLYQGDVPSDQE